MRVLLVNQPDQPLPRGTIDLIRDMGWTTDSAAAYRQALQIADAQRIDAVLLAEPDPAVGPESAVGDFNTLLRWISGQQLAAVMFAHHPPQQRCRPESFLDIVDRNICLSELRGRLAMIERYHSLLKGMDQELNNMQRLGKKLNRHFREVDQEMRLAGRLQREFLPDLTRPIGNARFDAVYRPASWVSGDIYDVFRIDEEVTGFYLVDAVGHGMAASLLTMFIKRSIVSKQIGEDDYRILSPSETLSMLNESLVEQSLPNCQFVTACYGLFHHRTHTLQYARGGHPYPILITADGIVGELKSPGGLLGIFADEEFPTFETRLHPGDKLLLYTDGVEPAFQGGDARSHQVTTFQDAIEPLTDVSMTDLLQNLENQLDEQAGSLEPRDDITLVGLQVLEGSSTPSRSTSTENSCAAGGQRKYAGI